ncbi:hypothetical protein PV327_000208 [Microctonus hyperodae]|uniref:Fatty acid desaturase domain-containing protein n=1 Tax=Microctonus hyperodae TaxID=165561 RepID=A0AA39L232_MICHY|nr:hypothetical protein PV327_000208 [Microctonus hyperodae]
MPPNTSSLTIPSEPDHHRNHESTPMEMTMKKPKKWYEFETKIKWGNTIFIVILHCLCFYYAITFPYRQHPFLFFWGYLMGELGGIGITAGAHRLWAHRSYKAKLPLRIILAILFYSAGMNKMYYWVRDHRTHHKYTDTEADPHDSTRGFWFSHVGWLMMKKKNIVRERGRQIDMTDILQDPVIQFFDKYYIIIAPLLFIFFPIFIPVYFFNQSLKYTIISQLFVRYPCILNATWSVNSFAHLFGYHTYDKNIRPTENIWVSFFAAGEGWHNYHHVFPWDYRAAEFKGFFFNLTSLLIDLFAKIGWAYDLKQVEPEQIRKVVEQKGDGTHLSYKK